MLCTKWHNIHFYAKVPNAKENKAKIEQQITAVEARQQTVKDAIQSFNQVVEHNPEKPETNHSTISKIDQTTRIDSLNRVEMELTNALTQAEGKQRQSLEKQLASTKESKQLAERIQQEINTAASKQVAQENRTELVQLNSNEPLKNTVAFDFKTATTAHNKGIPIVLDTPKSEIGRDLKKNANYVINTIDHRVS